MSIGQMRWLPALRDLDPEQQTVINQPFVGSSFIYGPAGCGKTAITIWRAWTLCEQGQSFKVFVYTNVLLNFIRAAVNELNLPADAFESFYRWLWRMHNHLLGPPPQNFRSDDQKFEAWTQQLIRFFEKEPRAMPRYECILVDEAQDFNPSAIRLIRMLSRNVFVSGDSSQSLYNDFNSHQQFVQEWGSFDRQTTLLRNHRNPRKVAQLAALFLDSSPLSRNEFLRSVVGTSAEMSPVWFQVKSREEESDRIVDIIRQARGEARIGILLYHRTQVREMAAQLQQRGLMIYIALHGEGVYNFANGAIPVVTTIHSAKGLEFDWVILPGLNASVWDADRDKAQQRRLFFVALTRAKNRLYLISQEEQPCAYLQEIPSKLVQKPSSVYHATTATSGGQDDDLPF